MYETCCEFLASILSICIDVAAISVSLGTDHMSIYSLDSLDLGSINLVPLEDHCQSNWSTFFYLEQVSQVSQGCESGRRSSSRPIEASMVTAQAFGTVNSPLDFTNFFRARATCDICDQFDSKEMLPKLRKKL